MHSHSAAGTQGAPRDPRCPFRVFVGPFGLQKPIRRVGGALGLVVEPIWGSNVATGTVLDGLAGSGNPGTGHGAFRTDRIVFI